MAAYGAEPGIITASDLRNRITGLTHPESGKMYLVVKRGYPQFLIWPVEEADSIRARQHFVLRAIKGMNAIDDLPIIEEVPALAARVSMTELRRNIVSFTNRLSLHPVPGLITHYEVVVGVYVPLRDRGHARQFIAAINQQMAG